MPSELSICRRTAVGISVIDEPFSLRVTLPSLHDAAGLDLLATVTATLAVAESDADREALAGQMKGDRLTAATLAERFVPGLHRTLQATTPDVAAAIDQPQPLREHLERQLQAEAFAMGLKVRSVELHLHSPAMQRRDRQAATEAQREQKLQRLGVHLASLDTLRARHPQMPMAALLGMLGSGDREAAFAAMASAEQGGRFIAACGNALLLTDDEPRVVALDGSLGPARSVRRDGQWLLVGCREGVWQLPIDADGMPLLDAAKAFAINGDSPFGFNAMCCFEGGVAATHRDHGLVVWQDDGQTLKLPLTGGSGVASLHGVLLAAGDAGAARLDQLSSTLNAAEVVELIGVPDALWAVHADGRVAVWQDRPPAPTRTWNLPFAPDAAAAIDVAGGTRLAGVDKGGGVWCVAEDDAIVTRYRGCAAAPLIAAAGGHIAAASHDRRRLAMWRIEGGEPSFIDAARLTGHRVAGLGAM